MTELGPADALLALALVVATVTDLRTQKIYNALTFPLMLTGLGLGLAVGNLWGAFLGLAVAFLVHFALFAMGIDRAGDAKLMMGVGAFMGVVDMLEASLWSFVVFAPMGLVFLVVRGKFGNFIAALKWTFTKYLRPNFHPGERPEGTPLAKAPAILAGVVIARFTDVLGPLSEMMPVRSLEVGQPAPHFVRDPVFGLPVDTAALSAGGGLALVFLRHAGSALTRMVAADLEQIHEALELADLSLVAVVRGSLESARDLVPRLQVVFPVVHDPDGALYEAWGVGRSWWGLARDPGPLRLLRAAGAGQGRPEGPLDQLPAAFVVGTGGVIRWRWVGQSPTSVLEVRALRDAALSAQQGR